MSVHLVVYSVAVLWLSLAGFCGWLIIAPLGEKPPRDWTQP